MQPTKHFLYTRCSTEEQGKNGFSHQYQLEELQQLVPGTCVSVFSDTITGTTFVRPQLDQLIRLCEKHRGIVSHIWVQRWDRFGRDLADGLMLIRRLTEAGVEVNCPAEYIDFTSDDWVIMLSLKLGFAQVESMRISSRTRNGIRAALMAGFYTASAPFGYIRQESEYRKSGGKRRRILVPDPVSSIFVKDIYSRYVKGESRSSIWESYRKKLSIERSSFYVIFQRPVYAGLIIVDDQIIKAVHKPLISISTYNKTQELLATEGERYKPRVNPTRKCHDITDFFAKGIILDPKGRYMTASYSKGKAGKYYGYYRTVKGKDKQNISSTIAHASIRSALDTISISLTSEDIDMINQKIQDRLAPDLADLEQHNRLISKLQKRLRRLDDDYLDSKIEASDYQVLKAKIAQDLATAEKSSNTLQETISSLPTFTPQHAETFADMGFTLDRLDATGKAQLLRAVFPEHFFISKEDRTVRTPYVNQFLSVSDLQSVSYKQKKCRKNSVLTIFPTLGGRPTPIRTPIQDLLALLSIAS